MLSIISNSAFVLPVASLVPPIPPFDRLHPLVVHFPIALVLVAPVFILLAVLLNRYARPLLLAATLLVGMGAVAAAVAVESGEAAEHFAEAVPAAAPVLDQHASLAKKARNASFGLTGLMAMCTLVVWRSKEPMARKQLGYIAGGTLAAWAGTSLLLANAAHEGGRLVHEFGVRAWAEPAAAPATGQPPSPAGAATRDGAPKPPGLITTMQDIDYAFARLEAAATINWQSAAGAKPLDAVAAEIAAAMTALKENARVKAKPEEFLVWLLEDAAHAATLRDKLKARAPAEEIKQAFTVLATGCDRCHNKYRE